MDSEKINQSISTIFRATRKFHNLRQAEFAAMLGITQGTVSKIESGIMHPELILWFKFLKMFKITNSSCFTQNGAEFSTEVFNNLKTTGSPLLQNFSFTDKEIFTVKRIKPFFDILSNNHSKEFNNFLRSNSIDIGIFYITNHPLTFEFADLFFTFLKERKIDVKTMPFLDFNMDSNDFESLDNFSGLKSVEQLFLELDHDSSSFIKYKLNTEEQFYTASLNKKLLSSTNTLANKDFILNYNVLYPYYLLKSNKDAERSLPKMNEGPNALEWKISYAG